MKCNVELITCGESKLLVTKKLTEIIGCGLSSAKSYVDGLPCVILEGVDLEYAKKVCEILQDLGAEVNIIEKAEDVGFASVVPVSSEVTPSIVSSDGGDREMLVKLWCSYTEHDKTVAALNKEIESDKRAISNLEKEIEKKKSEIEQNKLIYKTGGECLRPKVKQMSLIDFPEFETVKWIFVASAIISFIIMLIMVGVASETIEGLAELVGVPAGVLVWLGAPVIGLIASLAFSVVYMIKEALNSVSYNNAQIQKRNSYDVTRAKNEAAKYLDNLESHTQEVNKKEREISEIKSQINELAVHKNKLPIVQNTLAMPNELRSAQGVALLIQYIDIGRADTLKEAINLYCQDLKDSARMAELKKQTQYAQEQMLSSREAAESARVAAENTRRNLEETRRVAAASERAADAAEETARYERYSYWQNISNQSKN